MSRQPSLHDVAIVLSAIEVRLGEQRVLGPLDLRVERGEYVLVVGRSGSGKTTLLRAIAGLVPLSSGWIDLDGRRANDGSRILARPEQRAVGFLFQGGGLWPHMTAARTLDFVLRCRKLPREERRRRTGELLDLVELTGLDDRRPGELSGGEAQRLALARALAVEPRLLLLDEPLGPVDAELRTALIARLQDVRDRLGVTTLHVTHDPGEVRRLSTRTVRLEAGTIAPAAAGPSSELRAVRG